MNKSKIGIPRKLYQDVLKDIKNVPINIEEIQKQDWQVLPYYEMSKYKWSCSDIAIEKIKVE